MLLELCSAWWFWRQSLRSMGGPAGETFMWQPWLCPPVFVAETKRDFIHRGRSKVLPFDWVDRESLAKFARGSECTILSLTFDNASSNIAAVARMLGDIFAEVGPDCSSVLVHGERCLVHQLQIIKSASLSLARAASMLYCISKILQASRAASGIADAIRQIVRQNLVVRYVVPPDPGPILAVVQDILCIDNAEVEEGRRQKSGWAADVEAMCRNCFHDPSCDQWVHYTPPDGAGRLPDVDIERAAADISEHLVRVLVRRRWPVAALSRWTGVLSRLKRMLLGAVMGDILPRSLAGLSARMSVTKKQVQAMLAELAAKVSRGADADNHFLHENVRESSSSLLTSAMDADRGSWACCASPQVSWSAFSLRSSGRRRKGGTSSV